MKSEQKLTETGEQKQKSETTEIESDKWILYLYVAGHTPKSVIAFKNLKVICEKQLKDKYRIEVIDLMQNPQLAKEHQIIAIPTLIRKLPIPIRKIIGDLSDTDRVLVGLGLKPAA